MSHPDYEDFGSSETKLIEEIGELLLAISKAKRFGLFNHHPDRPTSNNYDEIRMELDDLNNAMVKFESDLKQKAYEYFGEPKTAETIKVIGENKL